MAVTAILMLYDLLSENMRVSYIKTVSSFGYILILVVFPSRYHGNQFL